MERKLVVYLEEVVKYRRQVEFSIPEGTTHDEIEGALRGVERNYITGASDVELAFPKYLAGAVAYQNTNLDDFSSPDDVECEIMEYEMRKVVADA